MVQCKKQPIVQSEPLDPVSTIQLNTNIEIQFPCETWQSAGTCHHQYSRYHKGWPVTGLHPFLTSDMDQHEFTILKLNAKIHS